MQFRVVCFLVILSIPIQSVVSELNGAKPPRSTTYSNNEGHNHHQVHYDNAYFYDYRIHGSDKKHHGEAQYFGQSEYRNELEVNKKMHKWNYMANSDRGSSKYVQKELQKVCRLRFQVNIMSSSQMEGFKL